jgi:hypothetical protein
MPIRLPTAGAALVILPASIDAQQASGAPGAGIRLGPAFKVRLDFNRWHDVAELKSDMREAREGLPEVPEAVVARQEPRRPRHRLMIINNPDTGRR